MKKSKDEPSTVLRMFYRDKLSTYPLQPIDKFVLKELLIWSSAPEGGMTPLHNSPIHRRKTFFLALNKVAPEWGMSSHNLSSVLTRLKDSELIYYGNAARRKKGSYGGKISYIGFNKKNIENVLCWPLLERNEVATRYHDFLDSLFMKSRELDEADEFDRMTLASLEVEGEELKQLQRDENAIRRKLQKNKEKLSTKYLLGSKNK